MSMNPPKPAPTPREQAIITTRRIMSGQGVAIGIVIGFVLATISYLLP